ncbi:hypothetical protein BDQ17DRAFT_1364686 [Cyathus striatus]|nr:hypothetical protein BDQ17DRAFT_1364686 [Cyathus striatus]
MAPFIRSWHLVFFYLLLGLFLSTVGATVVQPLPLSFMFDWNNPEQPVPIPISEQCETLHITWGRDSTTGPNPVAPYFLQVYSSNSTVPFIIPAGDQLEFGWQVPFIPGTLFQICMFDINGNTGGCQATYTVVQPSTTPNCSAIPTPPQLGVKAKVENGPLSRFGFIDQCTDISVTPTNGVPPYTMTVAPALHPPFNLTSTGMNPLNWTVSLSWASPFFISMFDSGGNAWSAGPLHSGGPGQTTSCLTAPKDQRAKGIQHTTAALMTVAALLSGLVVGVLSAWLLLKLRRRRQEKTNATLPRAYNPTETDTSTQMSQNSESGLLSRNPSSRADVGQPDSPSDTRPRQGAVYVVHRDNGTAPIEVFIDQGERVVELPPGYIEETTQPAPAEGARPGDKRRTLPHVQNPSQVPQPVRRKPTVLNTVPGYRPGLPDRPYVSRSNSFNSVLSISSDPFSTRAEASNSYGTAL